MRIDHGDLGFSTPPALNDVTGYSFKAPRPERELCEVTSGALPAGVRDLDGLLADRRDHVDIPGASLIEGEGTTRLAGLPARTLTFVILDVQARYRERWALALDTPDTCVQIAYSGPADNVLIEPRFLHVVASASLDQASLPTPPDYVRRWAGKLWIDVPAHLAPPRNYQFLSVDETRRLTVQFFPAAAEPTIESELVEDQALGETVREQSSAEIATPYLTGTRHLVKLVRTEAGLLIEEVVVRVHLRRGDVAVVHVSGRAPSIDEARLDAEVDALVQSFSGVQGP